MNKHIYAILLEFNIISSYMGDFEMQIKKAIKWIAYKVYWTFISILIYSTYPLWTWFKERFWDWWWLWGR